MFVVGLVLEQMLQRFVEMLPDFAQEHFALFVDYELHSVMLYASSYNFLVDVLPFD